jgi:hypothetical protein
LIDKVTAYIDDKRGDTPDKWVDGMEAMRLLSIKSTTTLQKLRDEGVSAIRNHSRGLFCMIVGRLMIISSLMCAKPFKSSNK